MTLFVHIVPECEAEAAKHTLTDALLKTREQIEKDQDTRLLSAFRYPYFVKKQFGGRQGRLITVSKAIEIEGEIHTVLIFLAVVLRADRSYADLVSDAVRVGESLIAARVDEAALQDEVRARMADHTVTSKQTLLEAESDYLYAVSAQHDDHQDDLVYESVDWFLGMQQAFAKQVITRIFDTLTQVQDCTEPGGKWLSVEKAPGLQILVRSFPRAGFWFLVALTEKPEERSALESRYGDILFSDENDIPELVQRVLEKSRKVYPALLTADESLWRNVALDSVGNLALSPEESDVLSVTRHQSQAFPLFINGRAGSGKSTVLQYLFADYLYFYLRHPTVQVRHPVYFSCSQDLILRARDVVRHLLACSSRYWKDSDRHTLIEQNRQVIEESFAEFRGFLWGQLLPEDRDSFVKSRHVDYSRFRSLWMKQFQKNPQAHRRYPPDVCWHIIRSYIKGNSADEFLEPDDYLSIELKQQSVSAETFNEVYERVWLVWYKEICHTEKLWDDQDLARFLLTHNRVKPVFPAIFCDESQDFTRLELEVILRMSLFSDKKVAPHEIRRVPFVFAGDPFQTLNPTGFRWEATKAQFVEKFIFELDPTQQSGSDINYRELTHNFRSATPIVRFSNVIQAFRAMLFRLGSLRPQIPWGQAMAAQPGVGYYSADNNNDLWRKLMTMKDLVFVVPCLENDELEYISTHPHLKRVIKVEENGSTSIPVLSASRAKGLEFGRVVVLGFGEDCPLPLPEILANNADASLCEEAIENNLVLQYFLNRLYVAVTRAKQQLLIIDSEASHTRFWSYFHKPFNAMGLAAMRGGRDIWEPMLGHLEESMPLDMLTASANDEADILNNAEEFARNGRAYRDSYMLRQAGGLYRRLGQDFESQSCFADAEFYDEDYLKAGKLYEEAGQTDHAFLCFWRAMSWKELLDLGQKHTALKSRPAYRLALLFRNGSKTIEEQGAVALMALSNAVAGLTIEHPMDRDAWQKVLRGIMDALVKGKKVQDWAALHKTLERIAAEPVFGELLVKRQQADVAFRAGDFYAARRLWEAQRDTPPNEYYIAVAETDPFPDNMVALRKVKRVEKLLELYGACDKAVLQPVHWNTLLEVWAEEGDFAAVRANLAQTMEPSVFVEVRRLAHKAHHEDIVQQCRRAELVAAVHEAKWPELLKVLVDRQTPPDEETTLIVARALARSDDYNKLSGSDVLLDNHMFDNDISSDSKTSSGRKNASGRKKDQQRPIRTELSDFLKRSYLGSQDDKKSTGLFQIPEAFALEIGAAFERGGRYADSLFFYETLMRRMPALKEPASLRWIACKEIQVRTLEKADEWLDKDIAKASSSLEREMLVDKQAQVKRTAQEARKKAQDARREMRLSSSDVLAELPRLTQMSSLLREVLQPKEAPVVPETPVFVPSAKHPEAELSQQSVKKRQKDLPPVIGKESILRSEGVKPATAMNPDPVAADLMAAEETPKPEQRQEISVGYAQPDAAPDSEPESVLEVSSWWPAEKMAAQTEWNIGKYRIRVIRKTRRINIEDTETGETVSVLQGGTDIQSEWDFQTDELQPGIIRFIGTELWLDTGEVDRGIMRVGFSGLGLAFQVNLNPGN